MKLGKNVLIEIVSVVQRGLFQQIDVSEELRAIDVIEEDDEVTLSAEYILSKERLPDNA